MSATSLQVSGTLVAHTLTAGTLQIASISTPSVATGPLTATVVRIAQLSASDTVTAMNVRVTQDVTIGSSLIAQTLSGTALSINGMRSTHVTTDSYADTATF